MPDLFFFFNWPAEESSLSIMHLCHWTVKTMPGLAWPGWLSISSCSEWTLMDVNYMPITSTDVVTKAFASGFLTESCSLKSRVIDKR